MHARVFVDTNIWLYALIQSHADDSRHQQARDFLLGLERPVINSQVIREISSNLIKKARLPEAQLRELLEGWYRDCEVITSNAAQHLLASQLRGTHSLSYWEVSSSPRPSTQAARRSIAKTCNTVRTLQAA